MQGKSGLDAREHYDVAHKMKTTTEEQIREAIRHLNCCLEVKPTMLPAILLRANLSARLRHYSAAIADFSLALQVFKGITPQNGGVQTNSEKRRLASLYGQRGLIYVKQARYQEGLADLQKATETEGDNGVWLYEIGKVYLEQDNPPFAQYYFQTCSNDKLYKISDTVKFKALCSLGKCRLATGDTREALSTFLKAKDISDTATLQNFMGLSSYRAGYYKSAVDYFSRAVEMDRTSLDYHMNLAIAAYRSGNLKDAEQYFFSAGLQGETPTLFYFRGMIQLALGVFSSAKEDFDQAIQLDEPRSRYHYAKVLLFMSQSNVEEAQKSCQTALSISPNHRRCLAHQGIIYHYRGDLHRAIEMLQEALNQKPDDVILMERLGLVYCDLGYYDAATRCFERCCDLKPSSGIFFFRKAVSQISEGDSFGAHESIVRAMDTLHYRTPMSFHLRSVALKKLGHLEEALAWSRKAIEKNKVHYKFFLNRAEIYYELRLYKKSIEDIDELLSIEKNVGEAYYLRGRALHAISQSAAAADDFKKAVELIPELKTTEQFHYCSGVVCANAQQWNEACYFFTQAIQCSSSSSFVRYFHERAKVFQHLDKQAEAVKDLSVVLEHEPKNFRALLRRCFSYQQLEKFNEAALDWKAAVHLDQEGLLEACSGIHSLHNVKEVLFTSIFEEEL